MSFPVPDRIAKLPKDHRGYPIPWNVLRDKDGGAIFTVNNTHRAMEAMRCHLCPICGESLGRWKWFVGGPRSAFDPHGWYIDLPGHHECIQFALMTCPYLAAPKYLGRIDVPDRSKLPDGHRVLIDETMIPERPEIFVAVAGKRVETQYNGPISAPYVRPVKPVLGYEFWREGKQITQEEAMPVLQRLFGAEWKLPEVER